MMTMEWRDIPGFVGLYQVSSCGLVRSLGRTTKTKNGRYRRYRPLMLRQSRLNNGYLKVSLISGGKYFHKTVHSLVCSAFLGPRPPGLVIAHYNGIKHDNRIENLRYATKSENMRDCYRLGELKAGDGSPVAKINSAIAERIRREGGSQSRIAAKYGVSQSLVSQIKRGKVWANGKFSLTETP